MCPTDERLQQFLNGTLPEGESPTLDSHVQDCVTCQQSLDRLTAFANSAWLPASGIATSAGALPNLPGYVLEEELGRGGYGVVYRARATQLDRLVAIKLLKQGALADSGERNRFLNEARAAARLTHPHIVPVYEVSEAEGAPFIAMEYLRGGSLSKQLDGTPLPDRETAKLVSVLARALQYAHEQGVVHRDLKPGNILLQTDEETSSFILHPSSFHLKVADFGTARLMDSPSELTPTQAILGTPSYMAPEQAFGQSRAVGPAADVYSLGAILYELLTGRPPFKAATPFETLVLVRDEECVPVRRLQPRVPRDLDTICAKCLEKDPARRYKTAGEFAEDLDRFREGKPILARPIGPIAQAIKWTRRHPTAFILSTALVILATASLITVTVLWQRSVQKGALAEKRGNDALARERLATDTLERSVQLIGLRRGAKAPLTASEEKTIAQVLELYERLLADVGDDPEVRWKLVQACSTIGSFYAHRGDHLGAERIHQRAMDLLADLSAKFPDEPKYKFEMARQITSANSGHGGSGGAIYGEALRKSIAILAEIRKHDPGRREWALMHANNLCILGSGPFASAEECSHFQAEARKVCQDRLTVAPSDQDFRLIDVVLQVNSGRHAAEYRNDFPAALGAAYAGIALFKDFRKVRESSSEGLDSLSGCFVRGADYAWKLGHTEDCLKMLRDGDQCLAEAIERFPDFAHLQFQRFWIVWRLGHVLWMTDRPKAKAEYDRGKTLLDRFLKQSPQEYLDAISFYIMICPVAEFRDREILARPEICRVLERDTHHLAAYWITMGKYAEARDGIARWRKNEASKFDANSINRMDLIEIKCAILQGDLALARERYETVKAFPTTVFDMAIEHDLLKREVAELIGQQK